MWKQLTLFVRRLLLLAGCGVLIVGQPASLRAGVAPSVEAKHGLVGSYYVANFGCPSGENAGGFYRSQVCPDENNYNLPRVLTAPVATRVDPHVAFGQGEGFHAKPEGPPTVWWPTDWTFPNFPTDRKNNKDSGVAAVIWKGYIHLPKAGTYYFATSSDGSSAVYLNQSRVALNGLYGGVLISDAFSYAKEQVQDWVQNRTNAPYGPFGDLRDNPKRNYVLPVAIEAPRDLPIEVQYNAMHSWEGEHLGIDLFWVTPDSPRDASGKPIAQIVPSEALYTDAPGPIEQPLVRGTNSTITASFLYFPMQGDDYVTVTVRLADKDGNPVAGKRIYVSGTVSGGASDDIVQPEKPTNEKGEATAKLRAYAANPFPHDSTIFVTDTTDYVDVAQVAHVTFEDVSNSFFPNTYAPYYDGKVFLVDPMPFRVGQRTTFKVPLINKLKNAAELAVSLKVHGFNIGAPDWEEVGRSERFRLKPGESREVSIFWTPNKESAHLCFRMDVIGHLVTAHSQSDKYMVASLLPTAMLPVASAAQPSGDRPLSSLQRNLGPVIDWIANKIGADKIPCGTIPGCSIDPKTGKVHIGGGGSVSIGGHDIGGAHVGGSFGAEQSPDPHKIFEWDYKGTVDIGGHETTIFQGSGVVPAPAISKDIDPNTSPLPQYRQLQQLDLP